MEKYPKYGIILRMYEEANECSATWNELSKLRLIRFTEYLCERVSPNSARQYAFLRKQDNEVLLIIANFDEISAHVSVNIPAHAFEYLDIPPMACRQAIDLLTGEAEQLDFTPDKATQVYVDGFGGKILKFTF